MSASRRVKIDILPQGVYRNPECDALVCIDVMVATTAIVTAVAQGRPTYLPSHVHEVLDLGRRLDSPLMVDETSGRVPAGFEEIRLAELERSADASRPLVIVSPWTSLLVEVPPTTAVYAASLRNLTATSDYLARKHERVALLAAGFGGQHRCEDQIAASAIVRNLVARGFEPDDLSTTRELESWADGDLSLVGWGKSAEYLRRAGRHEDVELILGSMDDIGLACGCSDGRAWVVREAPPAPKPEGAVVRVFVSRSGFADGETSVREALGLGPGGLNPSPLAS